MILPDYDESQMCSFEHLYATLKTAAAIWNKSQIATRTLIYADRRGG
jgi:hypothetical protein